MHCFICGHNNFSGLRKCENQTCKALLSTAKIVKYYTTTDEQRTVLGAMEHYIANDEGKLVQELEIPAGVKTDTVVQVQAFGVKVMLVVGENCGKGDCKNVIRCAHGSVKISFAEKRPADVVERDGGALYGATKTVAYPEEQNHEAGA
ncbi:hypothetical protein OCU04_012924 [Sclerotinia nivalis]|uniref:Uncharacterized protein n=1 Tax=Sclerotinia nivalis TaxID=352851 RepID=A0A9X0DD28_9HELO|nr:hypothetical protein OCU04_012924 [Sclerotinia nivalis]